jgi:small subunit ribosomal protein S16
MGTNRKPAFRVVVADARSPRDGKFIEEIGVYHPRRTGQNFTIDSERARFWIARGAQPSETVASFLRKLPPATPAAAPAAATA